MSIMHRLQNNPVGNMGSFLAGTGHLMLAGGVALTLAFTASRGQVGSVAMAACVLAALVSGYQGLSAMIRFVRSGERPASSALLALATGFFAILAGGLLGVVVTSVIGKALLQAA